MSSWINDVAVGGIVISTDAEGSRRSERLREAERSRGCVPRHQPRKADQAWRREKKVLPKVGLNEKGWGTRRQAHSGSTMGWPSWHFRPSHFQLFAYAVRCSAEMAGSHMAKSGRRALQVWSAHFNDSINTQPENASRYAAGPQV